MKIQKSKKSKNPRPLICIDADRSRRIACATKRRDI
jgi:hypothetical protein